MMEEIKMDKLVCFLKKNLNSILFFVSINAIYFMVVYLNNVDLKVFLQGFEIGFKKTLERGKYMKKENGVTKQVGKKLNFWQKLWK